MEHIWEIIYMGNIMEIKGYEWNLNTNGDIIPSREY